MCAAEASDEVVRDALVFVDRDRDDVLGRSFLAFPDRLRNFACLAETDTDAALAVADNDESGETHRAAALDGLADALDGYDSVVELRLLLVSFTIHCHCNLPPS